MSITDINITQITAVKKNFEETSNALSRAIAMRDTEEAEDLSRILHDLAITLYNLRLLPNEKDEWEE